MAVDGEPKSVPHVARNEKLRHEVCAEVCATAKSKSAPLCGVRLFRVTKNCACLSKLIFRDYSGDGELMDYLRSSALRYSEGHPTGRGMPATLVIENEIGVTRSVSGLQRFARFGRVSDMLEPEMVAQSCPRFLSLMRRRAR